MLEILRMILSNFMFFFLHLKNGSSFPKPLSAEKERELLLAMKKDGNKKARNTLIEHNLRLVSHIIKKYYSTYTEQEDLISVGTMGLIKAVDTFDPEKGARLATYASRCIENEILMFFRGKKKDSCLVSLDEPIDTDSEGNPLSLMDVIATEDTLNDDLDLKIKTKALYAIIEKMPVGRDRQIIIWRYGLYHEPILTQNEIASLLGISRSYVSRIEKRIIEELKREFKVEN